MPHELFQWFWKILRNINRNSHLDICFLHMIDKIDDFSVEKDNEGPALSVFGQLVFAYPSFNDVFPCRVLLSFKNEGFGLSNLFDIGISTV